jgi:hypothetical protein
MPLTSWLEPHLLAVLDARVPVLEMWRQQLPGLQGHVRNFENWLLVELNHQLLSSGYAEYVLTNGFFVADRVELAVKPVRAQDVPGLSERTRATYLSADLSARTRSGETLVAEIKTGLAGLEIIDDVRRVQHYKATVASQAEVGWAVILPSTPARRASAVKSVGRIAARVASETGAVVKTTAVRDWLLATVITPNANSAT